MRIQVLFLAAVGAAVSASEGYDEIRGIARTPRPEYIVDGLPVHAMGNQDPDSASWIHHPYLLIGGGVDDEHQLDPNDGWDGFARGIAGIESRWKPRPELLGTIVIQTEFSRHGEFTDRDGWQGSLDGQLYYLGPWWSANGIAGASRTRDPEEAGDQPVIRDDAGANTTWWRTGPGLSPNAGVALRRIDYREDTTIFTKDEADRIRLLGNLKVGWRSSAGTDLGVILRTTMVRYDTPERFQDSDGLALAVTWSPFDLSYWNGVMEVGYQARRFTDNFSEDPAYEDSYVAAPYLLAELHYQPEIMTDLLVRARSDLDDGRTSNAQWRLGADATLRWRLLRDRWLLGTVQVNRVEDSGAPNATTIPVSYVYGAEFGFAQQIAGGMTWRIRSLGTYVDPTQGDPTWIAEASTDLIAYW